MSELKTLRCADDLDYLVRPHKINYKGLDKAEVETAE